MLLVLASASPARLAVLRSAGVDPVVVVSGVDEDAIAAELAEPSPADLVVALAGAKAREVAPQVAREHPDAVVIGCDSMLHAGNELVGKPETALVAVARWWQLAGGTADLLTGHAVLRLEDGELTRTACAAQTTVIRFGTPTPTELDAYLATGEPLDVAGGFTPRRAGRLVHRGRRRRPVQRDRDQPAADPAAARRGRCADDRAVAPVIATQRTLPGPRCPAGLSTHRSCHPS